jgi:hypothetical protein
MDDETVLFPSQPQGREAQEPMMEVLPLAEEPRHAVGRGQTISLADEVGRSELGEMEIEPVDKAMDQHDRAIDRAAGEAQAAEELFAAGIVGEQAELPSPAPPSPPWFGDLVPLIAGLQGQCPDAAVAALRHQIATVAARQVLPPVAGIALDLLAAVAAQLAAMAAGERGEGVALLESLCAQVASPSHGVGPEASQLAVIQSLVHGYVTWQQDAILKPPGRAAVDQVAASAPVAPVLAEEARPGPVATPETRLRRDHTAPAGSFFEKIRQLFKK